MHIPPIPDYNSIRFSGCSEKFANFHGPKRLYAHGFKYELILHPITAAFDFVWEYKIKDKGHTVIIRNRPFNCPLQLITVDEEIDYESFTSLN